MQRQHIKKLKSKLTKLLSLSLALRLTLSTPLAPTALSAISDDNVLIEFENATSYKVGEGVLVIGSLELSEESGQK